MDQAITAMWQWWAHTGAAGFAQAIGQRRAALDLADQFSPYVAAIHPGLAWELGPGAPDSEHSLTVSSGGMADLRALAERVVRAAPAPTATWSYRSSRWRAPDLSGLDLKLDGQDLPVADFQVGMEEDRAALRIHVGVDHPAFGQLSERTRRQAAFLALDWTLGEDDVERWVGTVEVGFGEATLTPTLQDLRRAVDDMAQWWLGENPGQPHWRILRGTTPGGQPVLATAMFPLRWIDHLPLDWHLGVTVNYRPNAEGFPQDAELTRVRELQDEVIATLGTAALEVAHESCDGKRLLHFYYDGTDTHVEEQARAWSATHPGTHIETHSDPQWHEVRALS